MYHLHRDDEWLDQPATRREGRAALRMVAIASTIAFILLGLGGVLTTQAIVNNTKEELINSSVAICQRGIPVRTATNAQSAALRIVAENTAKFLETSIAKAPPGTPEEDIRRTRELIQDYKLVARSQPTIPIVDCETTYRSSID